MPNLVTKETSLLKNSYAEFFCIIQDLVKNETVQKMRNFNQHANTSCYRHCMQVAFYTYLVCKKLHLDYISATRGAMLHDLFLYDWHTEAKPDKSFRSFHAFRHPKVALKNAMQIFDLNDIEKDVILNHMWPVTVQMPHYKETLIVTFADKFSATKETIKHLRSLLHAKKTYRYAYVFLSLIIFRII